MPEQYDDTIGIPNPYHTKPVFISRGIGWAIYPVRFNCLPEIAVLALEQT